MKTKIPTRAIAVSLIGAIGLLSLGYATLQGITPETGLHQFRSEEHTSELQSPC